MIAKFLTYKVDGSHIDVLEGGEMNSFGINKRKVSMKGILGNVLLCLILGGAAIYLATMVFTNGFESKTPVPAKVARIESHIRMWGQYSNVAILELSNGETCTLESDGLTVGESIDVYYRRSNDTCRPAE